MLEQAKFETIIRESICFISGSEFESFGYDLDTIINPSKLDYPFFTFFIGENNLYADYKIMEEQNHKIFSLKNDLETFNTSIEYILNQSLSLLCTGKTLTSIRIAIEYKHNLKNFTFEFVYKKQSDSTEILIKSERPSLDLTNLEADTSYSIKGRIINKNNNKKSSWSIPIVQKTLKSIYYD